MIGPLKITVIRVGELEMGKNVETSYHRVEFAGEDGRYYHSDIVPAYTNYNRWKPLEVGVTYDGAYIKAGELSKIDGDSPVFRIHNPTPYVIKVKPKPVPPPESQLPLL